MSCLDDDAQGQPLSVSWEREVDAVALPDVNWGRIVARGFEKPIGAVVVTRRAA